MVDGAALRRDDPSLPRVRRTMAKAELRDPRERGPKPPFPQPPQAPPGKDDRMQPFADHGEKDYDGRGRLKDRVALVTGGDSGIGRAVALLYAQEGAKVVITCLPDDASDGRITVETIAKLGGSALSEPGDVRDPAFCKRLVERTVSEYGSLDILVNNAAFQRHHEELAAFTPEEIDTTFRTNVYGTIFLTQAAEPHLRPGACVINVTSIQAKDPTPQLLAYAATKAAISNLTRGLAGLLKDRGVRVNAVAPGPVWTPLVASTLPPEQVRTFGQHTMLGRPAQPVEQATLFVFLASDDASYVTGEVFGATGGRSPV
jgi:NAD(P)-dependent dehydrogenase (short-subunit alcohol dehydrogenase family)